MVSMCVATGLGYGLLHSTQKAPAFLVGACWPKFLLVGGRKLLGKSQGTLGHFWHVLRGYIAQQCEVENIKWRFHILLVVKRCLNVETFDVNAHKSCVIRAEDAIPQELGGREVGRLRFEFTRVLN